MVFNSSRNLGKFLGKLTNGTEAAKNRKETLKSTEVGNFRGDFKDEIKKILEDKSVGSFANSAIKAPFKVAYELTKIAPFTIAYIAGGKVTAPKTKVSDHIAYKDFSNQRPTQLYEGTKDIFKGLIYSEKGTGAFSILGSTMKNLKEGNLSQAFVDFHDTTFKSAFQITNGFKNATVGLVGSSINGVTYPFRKISDGVKNKNKTDIAKGAGTLGAYSATVGGAAWHYLTKDS